MGKIEVTFSGSFGNRDFRFSESAQAGGHAAALGRVIGELASRMPEAIRKDHELHDQDERPPEAPFGSSGLEPKIESGLMGGYQDECPDCRELRYACVAHRGEG